MSTTAWLVGGGGEEATRMSTHWEAIGTIKMPPYCVEIKMNTTDAYVLTWNNLPNKLLFWAKKIGESTLWDLMCIKQKFWMLQIAQNLKISLDMI